MSAICNGLGSAVRRRVPCPWCWLPTFDEAMPLCLVTPIFDGYGGFDYRCGRCGYYWCSDGYDGKDQPQEKRDRNIAEVRRFRRGGKKRL
jgi:hypothetical protein